MKALLFLMTILWTPIIFAQSQNPLLLRDVNTAPVSSNPQQFLSIGNTTFFVAESRAYGQELWVIDAITEEVTLLNDILPGKNKSYIQELIAMNGIVYFGAYDDLNGTQQLWRSDGTVSGTFMVKETGAINNMIIHQNQLFFQANNPVTGVELWKSDGTSVGTVIVKDIANTSWVSSFATPLFSDGNVLYFSAITTIEGEELWKTDGTAVGTVLVKDINSGSSSSSPRNFVKVNNTILFRANGANTGEELWKTDGTAAGTVLVKDINTGSDGSSIFKQTVIGNQLFFSALDGVHGRELWKTDGTSGGTVLVKDINTGMLSCDLDDLTAMNGILYFSANDGSNGQELWKSDGTVTGTILVKDINGGFSGSEPDNLIVWNNNLYFSAKDNANGRELWKSDGTVVGTILVKDINSNSLSSNPTDLIVINNKLIFKASDATSGAEWWFTDGTTANTQLIEDIEPGLSSSGVNSTAVVALGNNKMVYSARESIIGEELWVTNLSTFSTQSIDIYPGTFDGVVVEAGLQVFDDQVWFGENGSAFGLWRTDGTRAGTNQFLTPTGSISIPRQFQVVQNSLYYLSGGSEIWRTGQLTGNTIKLNDHNSIEAKTFLSLNQDTLYFNGVGNFIDQVFIHTFSSQGNSYQPIRVNVRAQQFMKANGIIYFLGGNNLGVEDLWRIDGDTAVLIKETMPLSGFGGRIILLGVANNQLYFEVEDGTTGRELWKTNGTVNGTVLVKDINPTGDANIGSFAVLNNTLYFTADDGVNGQELWKTDGTANGTVLVKDISPNTGSYIGELMTTGNTLYFAADDGVHGKEIWMSDGTTGGTVMVKDITTGSNWSNPTQLIEGGSGTLYFTAHDGQFNGLYQTDGTAANTQLLLTFDQSVIGFSSIEELTYFKGKLYFIAEDFHAGKELFVYDPLLQTVDVSTVKTATRFAKLYPNPNSGQFTLELDQMGNMNLVVLDVAGKLVHEEQIKNKQTIDVSVTDLAEGVYFIRLYNDEKSQLLKFIKH
jgi:ELWxxDGT repeat protein